MLLFGYLSVAPCIIGLARSQAGAVAIGLGALGLVLIFATWTLAYRRERMRPLDDLLTAAGLALVIHGVGAPQPVQGFIFSTLIFTLFYPVLWQSLVKVLLFVGVYFGSEFLFAGHLAPTIALSSVGFFMASLFTFLLARAIETQTALTADIQRREARFRALVQNGEDVVFVTDGAGTVRYQSPAAERVLGFAPDALLGKSLGTQLGGALGEALTQARASTVMLTAELPGKGPRELEAVVNDQRTVEAVQGLVVTVRDVTERNRTIRSLQSKELELRDAKHEIELASHLQTGLLPARLDVPHFTIAASMVPASEVGGDYYDVVPTAYGCWVGIGDVAGHGLDAGLVMLMAQSVVGTWVREQPQVWPSEVLGPLNRLLVENVRTRLKKNEHVTFTLLHLSNEGEVRFAGAHEDLMIYRQATRTVEIVPTTGTWVGLSAELRNAWPNSTLTLSPGDVLLLHTDGFTEARSAQGAFFGAEGVQRCLTEGAPKGPSAVVEHAFQAVAAWSPVVHDDRTLVVLRYDGR